MIKKILSVVLLVSFFASCNNSGKNGENPIDSLEQRKDTLEKKIDSTADATIDSVKNRAENLKEKLDSTFDARKDSLQKK